MARRELGESDGYEELRESILVAEANNSIEAYKSYNNLTAALHGDGRLRDQAQAELDALRVAERFGAAGHARWTRGGMCWLPYERGAWDEALRLANDFLAEIAGSTHYMEGGCRALLVLIGIAREDVAGARAEASAMLALGRGAKDPQSLYPSLGLNSYLLVETGAVDEAATHLAELLESHSRQDRVFAFGGPPHVVWAASRVGVERELLSHFTRPTHPLARSRRGDCRPRLNRRRRRLRAHRVAVQRGLRAPPRGRAARARRAATRRPTLNSHVRSRSTARSARRATCSRVKPCSRQAPRASRAVRARTSLRPPTRPRDR